MGSADSSGKVDWASGDGTGAFVVKHFEPGVRSHMVRNDNYWKPGCANFDEVKLTAINDAAARMNAMATGQVDAIVRCDLKTAPMLEKKPGISVLQVSGTKHFTYPMDVRQNECHGNRPGGCNRTLRP
jgi:peptide/nickel transport system substrate-binding protein